MVMISGVNGTKVNFLTAAEAAKETVLKRTDVSVSNIMSEAYSKGITNPKFIKTGVAEKLAKIKSFFTNLPENLGKAKKIVTEQSVNLKNKVTVENIKGLKDRIVAGIKTKFTAENLKATKDKIFAAFKDIPKKAAELKDRISNRIFNEAMKQKFANINWKSVGIKGAIVAGALLVLYAGVKAAKAIFGKNNA